VSCVTSHHTSLSKSKINKKTKSSIYSSDITTLNIFKFLEWSPEFHGDDEEDLWSVIKQLDIK